MKKALNNPAVVAVVALIAVASVVFTMRKRFKRFAPVVTMVKNQLNQLQQPAAPPAPALPGVNLEAARPIDRDFVRNAMDRWLQSPRRDPFGGHPLQLATVVTITNAPAPLTLTAIWRQTGRQLAVINGRVVTEGDKAFDYTVERIEDAVVILQGPAGPRRVEFPAFGPAQPAGTNQVAQVSVSAGS